MKHKILILIEDDVWHSKMAEGLIRAKYRAARITELDRVCKMISGRDQEIISSSLFRTV